MKYPIQSSRFIMCKGLTYSADGGAVCYWENNITLGLTDCLFSQCSAINGGGIFMQFPITPSQESIKFCFFHANTATESGKDISLYSLPSNYMPLLHSLTTSSVNTVVEHENSNDHSDWLPLGTLSSLNLRGESASS